MSATINVHDRLTWAADLIPDRRGNYVILRGTGPHTTLTLIHLTRDQLCSLKAAVREADDMVDGGVS